MYTAYYNLKETPFDQLADPKYTWLSEKQLEALAAFKQNYLDKKGIFLITGDAGTGKTAFIKKLLSENQSETIVATVTDPDLDKLDFFNWLSLEFNFNVMFKSKGAFLTRFKRFLHEAYQKNINVILIIDDAHRINNDLIEEILTLSNIEKDGHKLMSLFFVGQSGFNKILKEDQNSDLRNSVNAHFQLTPLKEDEIIQLISHRLEVAGAKSKIFSSGAFHEIYQFSAGYPIMVVNICDRAMMAGCINARPIIDKDLIVACSRDLQITGAKKGQENINYSDKIDGSWAIAAKTGREKNEKIIQSVFRDFMIRLAPVARTAILPVFLAMLCLTAVYFIYHFKTSLLSWTKIISNQEKATSKPGEPLTSNMTPKKEDEVEAPIQTAEKRAEVSDSGYALDELRIVEGNISPDDQGTPIAEESREIKSDAETASPPVLENKAAEIGPEKVDSQIEQLPLELPEIETVKESTEKEFKLLSRHLSLKARLSEMERQETEIQEFPLELKTGGVIAAQPANDSMAKEDIGPSQTIDKRLYLPAKERPEAEFQIVDSAAQTETASDVLPTNDSQAKVDDQPRPPSLPVKSDIDPATSPQKEPGTAVAALGQVDNEDDLSSRPDLKERLQAFLEVYCQTYEAKNLDRFSAFFTSDARENDKPFRNLLPKYRRNFDVIKFITYRIELQNYEYDTEADSIKIEGRFFLEWLPGDARWRRNSGKIFMALQASGTSFKISRLDYYGDPRKKIN